MVSGISKPCPAVKALFCSIVKTLLLLLLCEDMECAFAGDSRACASVGTDPVYGDVSSLVQVTLLLRPVCCAYASSCDVTLHGSKQGPKSNRACALPCTIALAQSRQECRSSSLNSCTCKILQATAFCRSTEAQGCLRPPWLQRWDCLCICCACCSNTGA